VWLGESTNGAFSSMMVQSFVPNENAVQFEERWANRESKLKEMKDSEELAMSVSKIAQSLIEQVDLSIPECEECAVKAEERALYPVQASEDAETSIESKAVAQSEVVEVDTPVVDQADSIEAKLMVDTGDEKVTVVSSTQKEVDADVKESLEMNTVEMNSMQNQVEKPTEFSYPTDEKIASVENKSSETSVEPFVNSLKRKRRSPKVFHRRVECCGEGRCKILECCKKIAEEDINQKMEASGGSAERAFETAIRDITDAAETVAEAAANGAKPEASGVRDSKAVLERCQKIC